MVIKKPKQTTTMFPDLRGNPLNNFAPETPIPRKSSGRGELTRPEKKVKFNPDGSVDVGYGNQAPIRFTAEEYRNTLLNNAGAVGSGAKNALIREQQTKETQQVANQNAILSAEQQFNSLPSQVQEAIPQIGNIIQPEFKGSGALGMLPDSSSLQGAIPDILANSLTAGATGAVTGAVAGAGAGSVVPILGTATGAIGGALIGLVGGVGGNILNEIKQEEIEGVTVQYTSAQESTKRIKSIIQGVNSGAIDPITGVNMYNNEIFKIQQAERNLKAYEERDWISKAKPELVKVSSFLQVQKPLLDAKLAQAVSSPDPNAFFEYGTETTQTNSEGLL